MEDGGERDWVWMGVRMEDGGERDRVWTGVGGGEDGRWRGARGCGRVWYGGEDGRWTGARRGVDGGEDGVWTSVDGGEDGRWRERGWVWTAVWMEDARERDGVWAGVDGGVEGRWRGARLGVDGCGRWSGWKMEGSETGCGRVWMVVRMEDEGSDRVWTGVDGGEDGRWRGARRDVGGCGRG